MFALGALGVGSASAAHGLISLSPGAPVVDQPAVVELRTPAKLRQPAYLVAENGTASIRVHLSPVVPHRWRAAVTFTRAGHWVLHAAGVWTAVDVAPAAEP